MKTKQDKLDEIDKDVALFMEWYDSLSENEKKEIVEKTLISLAKNLNLKILGDLNDEWREELLDYEDIRLMFKKIKHD